MGDVLALTFDDPKPAAGQVQPTNGRLRHDESFNSSMAFCRDEPPAVGPTPASPPRRAVPHRELTAPALYPPQNSARRTLAANMLLWGR